jgi:diacylglycerol kinase family enzyme
MPAPFPSPAPALVVLNAHSGAGCGPERAQELRELLAGVGIGAEVLLAQGGEDLLGGTERAVAAGTRLVIAAGGDGTQSAVASRLVGTDAVQGVLPMGTLNHFAKDLGIPLKLEDAVRTLAQGRVLQVDVGEVNDRVFINNSSLGLYPQIVRERELQQLHLGKRRWRALASAVLHATEGRPGLAVRVQAAGQEQVRRTPFVFVGNNRYTMEGFRIGARNSLQAGELALYLGRRTGRLGLVWLALRALARRLDQAKDFDMLTGGDFLVETRAARLRVANDGEVTMMDTPLRYRVRPAALRVMVPAG